MLIAEARVETEHASWYLAQLFQHLDDEAPRHPDVSAHIEWADDRGVADLGWGRCALGADSGVLTLRAEATDEESLQRIQHLVSDLLEHFATGDHLTVTWTLPGGDISDRGEAHG